MFVRLNIPMPNYLEINSAGSNLAKGNIFKYMYLNLVDNYYIQTYSNSETPMLQLGFLQYQDN